ncbi:lactococcin 972 family bacteriocin [Lysinibacillus pakistanensis]|uniref:lactococcin 972 family bacteriocin n=1 Tax=Lysinibacillus pakistanensis TaxID=759811 RepID=UPI003D2D229C
MFKKGLSSLVVAAFLTASAGQALAAEESNETSGSIDLTNQTAETLVITNEMVTPFSVNVGGGTWDYGTSVTLKLKKKAWSNYNHPTEYHSSSCYVGTNWGYSYKTAPKVLSKADAEGGLSDSTGAYWKFE